MPEKEGIETLLEIRQQYPDIPVFVMSGGGTRGKRDFLTGAKKFGATGVIKKPISPREVIRSSMPCRAKVPLNPVRRSPDRRNPLHPCGARPGFGRKSGHSELGRHQDRPWTQVGKTAAAGLRFF
jgi:chemotaxis response regulator CheB